MTKHWWTRALLGRTAVSNPLQDDESPSPQFEAQWRALVKQRLLVIVAIMALWVAGLEARLIWLQVIDHSDWEVKARNRQENIEPIDASRGDILDRDGRLLAGSVGSCEVHVNLKQFRKSLEDQTKKVKVVTSSAAFARQLCDAFGDCEPGEQALIATKLDNADTKTNDVTIRRVRQMSLYATEGVRALTERWSKTLKAPQPLIELKMTDARYYPNMWLAAQVIGFTIATGRDGKMLSSVRGVAGVEAKFDERLRGTPGQRLAQVGGQSRDMLTTVIKQPRPGVSLELTISSAIQEIAERALMKGVEEAGAIGGTAIVLDSMTGAVMAMANAPGYNLNAPGDAKDRNQQANHAIQDLYEPGSVFKMVTLSAALNEGVVNTHTLIDTEHGRYMVAGRPKPITEDQGHDYGTLDVQGVLVRSSNIGAAKIGLQLGRDLMLKYARLFGLYQAAAPDQFYSANTGGIFVPPQRGLRDADLAVVSYGYGVQVTPLQVVTAMNVFATGGLLVRPHLINATIENGVRTEQEPEILGRVITPETAATMTSMLEAVVADPKGTGRPAALARFQVAGKTGTTAKLINGQYSRTDYRVSFVGFVPSRHPRFTIIVMVDRPTLKKAYGGTVAAPIFKQIAEESLQYVGELPSINPAPPVIVTEGRPSSPPAPRPADAPAVILNAGGVPTMPNLVGLTVRDALKRLPPGLTMDVQGDSGVVVSQSPAAGEIVGTSRGTLRLRGGGR